MKQNERKAQLLSLWKQRPNGKRTQNDVVAFYAEMERLSSLARPPKGRPVSESTKPSEGPDRRAEEGVTPLLS